MERKQEHIPYSWLKRWVVLRDRYLLWSDRQISVGDNGVDSEERKRWNHSVDLTQVVDVGKVQSNNTKNSKQRRDWRFTLKTKKRTYLFRTKSEHEREEWLENLKININHCKQQRLFKL